MNIKSGMKNKSMNLNARVLLLLAKIFLPGNTNCKNIYPFVFWFPLPSSAYSAVNISSRTLKDQISP